MFPKFDFCNQLSIDIKIGFLILDLIYYCQTSYSNVMPFPILSLWVMHNVLARGKLLMSKPLYTVWLKLENKRKEERKFCAAVVLY